MNEPFTKAAAARDAAPNRASDAALAKATAQLATDKKSGAPKSTVSADQQAVSQATKATAKVDAQVTKDGGKVTRAGRGWLGWSCELQPEP